MEVKMIVMEMAAALVESGDIAGYRKFCESLSEAAAKVSDPTWANCLARAALLLPDSGLPLDECSRLTELSVKSRASSYVLPWSLATQALSEYRQGRFESAIALADRCLKDPRCHPNCRLAASTVLAMAHHRAGHGEETRIALQIAAEEAGKGWFSDERTDLGNSWHDRLIGHILLREARELIEGRASVAEQKR
jgi:hypothetical protein